MGKKWLAIIIFVLLFSSVYADEIEGVFKDICLSIKGQVNIPLEEQYRISQGTSTDKNVQNKVGSLPSLSKEWQDELRALIKRDPNSIWSDDAQYIIANLYALQNMPKQEAVELERLLTEYPNMHVEDWTRQTLSSIIPNAADDLPVRTILCTYYKQSGEIEKLKQLCNESIKKYPKNSKIFELMLN